MLEKGVGGSKYKLEYCLDSADRFRFCIMATFKLKRFMFIFLEGMVPWWLIYFGGETLAIICHLSWSLPTKLARDFF